MGDSPADEVEAAKATFEAVKLLWDDQVALADTLVEKRKTLSSMLAIVVGLGVFRIQFTTDGKDELALQGTALGLVRYALVLALVSFALGAYLLYTQRPLVRRVLHRAWDILWRHGTRLYNQARAANEAEYDAVVLEPPAVSPWPDGRALKLTLPPDEPLGDWFLLRQVEVIQRRTLRLQQAYQALEQRNKRVSDRISTAFIALFTGYVLVFCALGVYLVSIGRVP